jgi:hypothetical protein
MNTITAGDFTVELDLTRDQYRAFRAEHEAGEHKNAQGETEPCGFAFKAYLKEKVQELLSASAAKRKREEEEKAREEAVAEHGILAGLNPLGSHGPDGHRNGDRPRRRHLGEPDEDRTDVRIIDIVFAYNNHQMIGLLKKRGRAIATLNFEQMRALDE